LPPLAPDAERDYAWDWTADVTAESTTMSTSTFTVPTGLTNITDSHTSAGLATIRLRGDTAGTYTVTNTVVYANSETDSRSATIVVVAR
jgi:hypothetical protein